MSGLRYTVPVVPAFSELVSTTVPENDHSAWASGTTYDITDRVIYGHRVWESAIGSNSGQTPGGDPTKWIDAGPTNRWAAFTLDYASATSKDNGFEYNFTMREPINSVHLAGFKAVSSIRVKLYDSSAVEVYDSGAQSTSPELTDTTQWQWFFGSRMRRDDLHLTGLPDGHPNGELEIVVVGGTGCAISWIGWGLQREIGVGVKYGMRVSMEDYSKIIVDQFGTPKIQRRRASRRMNPTVIIEAKKSDDARRALFQLRATPIFWEASEAFDSTQMLGFYRPPLELVYTDFLFHELSMDIEGFSEE